MHELHYRKIDAISVRRDHSSHRDDFYEYVFALPTKYQRAN